MREFDWNSPEFLRHRPEVQGFIRTHHKTKMKEDEYIAGVKALNLPNSSPSKLKKNYRNLKAEFGFFV